jgi:fructose-1,6-bisphosphatase/inositol monophosphatase family enzyme
VSGPDEEFLRDAERLVGDAAALLMTHRFQPLLTRGKTGNDIVTSADLASERLLIRGIRRIDPTARILTEEAGLLDGEGPRDWIVDPLDGTINFATGLPWFSVTLAIRQNHDVLLGIVEAPAVPLRAYAVAGGGAFVDGRPAQVSAVSRLRDAVVSVVLSSDFTADETARTLDLVAALKRCTRGIRIVISGALELALVASGALDAFVTIRRDRVSHEGAIPIVVAGGGSATDWAGRAIGPDCPKLVSNGWIHDEILALIGGG